MIRVFGQLGEELILPRVRLIYDRLPLLNWRSKRYAASEVRKIRHAIKSKVSEYVIVFDCKVVGFAFGSLLNSIAVARYLSANGIFVRMEFVYPEEPPDNGLTLPSEVDGSVKEFIRVAETLLNPKQASVNLLSHTELEEQLGMIDRNALLFEDFTRDRRPYFRDVFNVFNGLMARAPLAIQDRTLFSSDDFKTHLPKQFPPEPYVSWHCRYSPRGVDIGRQTLEAEFLESYQYIRKRFWNHNIVIISDSRGCEHYAELAKQLQVVDLLFSKEYSSDFLGDAALIMNSRYFYWFRGGGIGNIALLSRMPFEMIGPVMNEIMWDRERLTSWQGDSQHWILLEKHQFVEDRSQDLKKIGSAWKDE